MNDFNPQLEPLVRLKVVALEQNCGCVLQKLEDEV